MTELDPAERLSIPKLIAIPAVITLGVTILRLVGELQHWSRTWFNPEAGGPWSVVGITWLPPVFGIYFALKLARAGEGPKSIGRAVGLVLLAVIVIIGLGYVGGALHVEGSFQGRLVYFWSVMVIAALITLPGWPKLFNTMLAYGYAAHIPVAVLMFFAFQGDWHTHYDALPHEMPAGAGLWYKYLWLGFVPQLIFWVGFTVVSGMLFGTIVALVQRLQRKAGAR